jgi:hypothetical protein
MNTIDDIIKATAEAGITLTPLIDHYAVNVRLDKCDYGLFVMLPTTIDDREGTYSSTRTTRIELVATGEAKNTNSDIKDYGNVADVVAVLIARLNETINAILATGRYDSVARVTYKIIPYRYDSLQTAVTATFDLVKPQSPC